MLAAVERGTCASARAGESLIPPLQMILMDQFSQKVFLPFCVEVHQAVARYFAGTTYQCTDSPQQYTTEFAELKTVQQPNSTVELYFKVRLYLNYAFSTFQNFELLSVHITFRTRACVPGEFWDFTNSRCQICPDGFFSSTIAEAQQSACQQCGFRQSLW